MNEVKNYQQNMNQEFQKVNQYNVGKLNQQGNERKGLHQTVKEKNLKVQTNFLRSQTRDVSAGAVIQGRNQYQETGASGYLHMRETAPISATTTPRVPHSAKANQKMIELSQKYMFNLKEIEVLKKRFDTISKKGILTLQDFKDSLGVMGRDNTLVDRIFALMDEDNIGQVLFEDYLRYLTVLLNGSQIDKAMLSFKILSNGKEIITFEDIYTLVLQVSYLWTNMTSTNCIPTQEYVENIFTVFDYDKDGEVSFDEQMNKLFLLKQYNFINYLIQYYKNVLQKAITTYIAQNLRYLDGLNSQIKVIKQLKINFEI